MASCQDLQLLTLNIGILAPLYKYTGRAIALPQAVAVAALSALSNCLNFYVMGKALVRAPHEVEIFSFSIAKGVTLHTAFHYHLPIILI